MTSDLDAKRKRKTDARRKRYAEDPEFRERVNRHCQVFYEAHKTDITAANRLRNKSNPEKVKHQNLKRYGITFADYQAMLARQNGLCAICEKEDAKRSLSASTIATTPAGCAACFATDAMSGLGTSMTIPAGSWRPAHICWNSTTRSSCRICAPGPPAAPRARCAPSSCPPPDRSDARSSCPPRPARFDFKRETPGWPCRHIRLQRRGADRARRNQPRANIYRRSLNERPPIEHKGLTK
jgi:hypothetical protein